MTEAKVDESKDIIEDDKQNLAAQTAQYNKERATATVGVVNGAPEKDENKETTEPAATSDNAPATTGEADKKIKPEEV